jgi:nucleoid-associated protein YgaU
MAGSLALAAMAVVWAIDLSTDSSAGQPGVPTTREGTLTGTPTPALASRPPSTPAPVTHTVARGDTLIELAARYYDDGSRWREIYRANAGQIPDPQNLRIGVVLVIPPP